VTRLGKNAAFVLVILLFDIDVALAQQPVTESLTDMTPVRVSRGQKVLVRADTDIGVAECKLDSEIASNMVRVVEGSSTPPTPLTETTDGYTIVTDSRARVGRLRMAGELSSPEWFQGVPPTQGPSVLPPTRALSAGNTVLAFGHVYFQLFKNREYVRTSIPTPDFVTALGNVPRQHVITDASISTDGEHVAVAIAWYSLNDHPRFISSETIILNSSTGAVERRWVQPAIVVSVALSSDSSNVLTFEVPPSAPASAAWWLGWSQTGARTTVPVGPRSEGPGNSGWRIHQTNRGGSFSPDGQTIVISNTIKGVVVISVPASSTNSFGSPQWIRPASWENAFITGHRWLGSSLIAYYAKLRDNLTLVDFVANVGPANETLTIGLSRIRLADSIAEPLVISSDVQAYSDPSDERILDRLSLAPDNSLRLTLTAGLLSMRHHKVSDILSGTSQPRSVSISVNTVVSCSCSQPRFEGVYNYVDENEFGIRGVDIGWVHSTGQLPIKEPGAYVVPLDDGDTVAVLDGPETSRVRVVSASSGAVIRSFTGGRFSAIATDDFGQWYAVRRNKVEHKWDITILNGSRVIRELSFTTSSRLVEIPASFGGMAVLTPAENRPRTFNERMFNVRFIRTEGESADGMTITLERDAQIIGVRATSGVGRGLVVGNAVRSPSDSGIIYSYYWINGNGSRTELLRSRSSYGWLSFSSDGSRLAIAQPLEPGGRHTLAPPAIFEFQNDGSARKIRDPGAEQFEGNDPKQCDKFYRARWLLSPDFSLIAYPISGGLAVARAVDRVPTARFFGDVPMILSRDKLIAYDSITGCTQGEIVMRALPQSLVVP
jgi:hypothetical protein